VLRASVQRASRTENASFIAAFAAAQGGPRPGCCPRHQPLLCLPDVLSSVVGGSLLAAPVGPVDPWRRVACECTSFTHLDHDHILNLTICDL
jgi:hypothetical protein